MRPAQARHATRLRRCGIALGALAWLVPVVAWAQAGPPMITNDPDTPGAGVWEINLVAAGTRGSGQWDLDAPDVDVNYGIGDRIQLSLHMPWAHRRSGGAWVAAEGDAEFGLRWRFMDQGRSGVAMAIQPMWIQSFSPAARRRGLGAAHPEFVLPLQLAHRYLHGAVGAELARHFIRGEADAWQAGVFGMVECRARWECLLEINGSGGADAQTIVNLGARRELSPHVTLLGSLGKPVAGQGRDGWQFYAGAQIVAGE